MLGTGDSASKVGGKRCRKLSKAVYVFLFASAAFNAPYGLISNSHRVVRPSKVWRSTYLRSGVLATRSPHIDKVAVR